MPMNEAINENTTTRDMNSDNHPMNDNKLVSSPSSRRRTAIIIENMQSAEPISSPITVKDENVRLLTSLQTFYRVYLQNLV